jgi:DNA helicase-2/ATP-dependent DNA helicase PcrA
MKRNVFDNLTESQQKAVFHKDGPLLILAGAGSGKTRVITYRIAALVDSGVPPYNICAITFTNKAADEMKNRCISLLGLGDKAQVSTYHSLCVRILRRYGPAMNLQPNFSIFDSADQAKCMKQAVADCDLSASEFSPARMLEAVSTLKNRLIDADSFSQQAKDYLELKLSKIYHSYQKILTESNALDFDDLLLKTAFLLRDYPDVCRELSNRFRYLLIDEYQDTNHAQYQIAKFLVSQHNNICATGDPDQSIYRWRGADIHNILNFEKDWPDAVVLKLEENFRSTAKILQAADALISHNFHRKQKVLIATKHPGNNITIMTCEDENDEARNVAWRIKELVQKGLSFKQIAIFYRINAMSRPLEEVFIKNKIPYQIVRGVEFYNRKEIRDMLGYLKVLINPADEVALLRIINNPARGIGKTTIDKVKEFAISKKITLYDALSQASAIAEIAAGTKAKIAVFAAMIEDIKKDLTEPVAQIVEKFYKQSGLEADLKQKKEMEALENINELISAAASYDKEAAEPSLIDYLQQVSLFSDVDAYDSNSERVALMTLHCAKGLEFDTVFIIGLEDGLMPHERSSDDSDDIEEERRLFFVGITRAKEQLFLSLSQFRTIRGQMLRTIPSQFLYELELEKNNEKDDPQPDEPEVAVEKDSYPVLSVGQLVRHKQFGMGRVKEFIDLGEDSIVIVHFNTGHTKELKLKYAKLSILS